MSREDTGEEKKREEGEEKRRHGKGRRTVQTSGRWSSKAGNFFKFFFAELCFFVFCGEDSKSYACRTELAFKETLVSQSLILNVTS